MSLQLNKEKVLSCLGNVLNNSEVIKVVIDKNVRIKVCKYLSRRYRQLYPEIHIYEAWCTPETLRAWVKKSQAQPSKSSSNTQSTEERLAALERENKKLKRTNDILRQAAAFFAQAELDRKQK